MSPRANSRYHRWLWILAGSAIFLASALRVRAANEPPPWIQVHAQHFVVVTDASDKRGREVALRFEQMRGVFGSLLSRSRLNMSVPLTIVALKGGQEYAPIAPLEQGHPLSAPGFLLAGEDRSFVVLDLSDPEPWQSVAGDFAALFLRYNYPPTPAWFDRGLADFFSSLRLDDRHAEIGGVTQPVLQRSLELLNSGNWIPVTDLFGVRPGEEKKFDAALFRAESWAVMHYLLSEQLLPQTGAYFELAQNQKVPVEQAIAKGYGVPATQFEAAVKAHLQSLRQSSGRATTQPTTAGGMQLPAPVSPEDVGMSVSQLPDVDGRALIQDIAARLPEHRDQAVRQLQALAGDPTNNETAHRGLAWALIQRGDFDRAGEELATAAELDRRDTWIRYYMSVLKYRSAQASRQPIQGLANMMQDLRAVIDWYPEFAEAYNMLAMGRVEGGGINSALEAMRTAMQLSPRNERYLYNLATIYVAGKRWEAAQALLQRLAESNNPQVSSEARAQLSELGTVQKYGVHPQPPASASKEPRQSALDELTRKQQTRSNTDSDEEEEPQKPVVTATPTGPIQFAKGTLVLVDCSHAPAAVVTLKTSRQLLKLQTPDYKSLTVIGSETFSCDWRNLPVSVNYRATRTGFGNLVTLEIQ